MVTLIVFIGPGLAELGNRCQDNSGVHCCKVLVAKAQFIQSAGAG